MMKRFLSVFLGLSVLMISCQKELSLEAGQPAIGSLQNSAGQCNPMSVEGNYIAAAALTDSNFIEVTVDVVVPGTYTIYTDTVNGYYFSGTGSFGTSGPSTVKLNGIGTPLSEGTDNFFVIFDSSFCSVSVNVLPAGTQPPQSPGNYFPLSQNSWWSYDFGGADTIKITANGSTTLAGNSYRNFVIEDGSGFNDTSYYRFNAGSNSYYQYIDAADAAGLGINFVQPYLDILFLKENLTNNATWNSDHDGMMGGNPVTLRFKFTATETNGTASVNGNSFTNVYRIQMQLQLGSGGSFSDAGTPSDFYYAPGVGQIRYSDGTDEENIRYWLVN